MKADLIYHIKVCLTWVISFTLVFGLGWLFFPLADVWFSTYMIKVHTGRVSSVSNYYGLSIGGITYIPEVGKFYIVLNKPYLFNPNYGYIYSSRDLEHWTEEYKAKGLRFGGIMTKASLAKYRVDESGNVFSRESSAFMYDVTNDSLPRYIKGDCYIIFGSPNGYIAPKCNIWNTHTFMSKEEQKKEDQASANREAFSMRDVNYKHNLCSFYNSILGKNHIFSIKECLPRLSINNMRSYKVLNNLIILNKLDGILSGAQCAYGSKVYVGIFWDKKYYFIISKDGKAYQIRPLPNKLTGSMVLMLFD